MAYNISQCFHAQMWHVPIYQAMSVSECIINQGVHTSAVWCVYRLGDIGHGLHNLSKKHQSMIGGISQGLHTFDVACMHGK